MFKDPFAVDFDDRKFTTKTALHHRLGRGRLLLVAYTMRGRDDPHPIGAGAEPHEQRQYHEDRHLMPEQQDWTPTSMP